MLYFKHYQTNSTYILLVYIRTIFSIFWVIALTYQLGHACMQ